MSNAQDYRTKAAEFAHLASKATLLKDIRELRQQAQAFRASPKTKNGWWPIETGPFRTGRPLIEFGQTDKELSVTLAQARSRSR
jgi:hypothetical protein